MNADQIKQAREWIAECINEGMFHDVDPDDASEVANQMSEAKVTKFVKRYYSGGLSAFIASCI